MNNNTEKTLVEPLEFDHELCENQLEGEDEQLAHEYQHNFVEAAFLSLENAMDLVEDSPYVLIRFEEAEARLSRLQDRVKAAKAERLAKYEAMAKEFAEEAASSVYAAAFYGAKSRGASEDDALQAAEKRLDLFPYPAAPVVTGCVDSDTDA